jgi:hypothetical protein
VAYQGASPRGWATVFDLSDHQLTTIATWAEVGILLWMVGEKFVPRMGVSAMTARATELGWRSRGLLGGLWQNRTVVLAIIGLVIVAWLRLSENAVAPIIEGFTQQQVDEKISAATKPLNATINALQQRQPNAELQAQLDGANNQRDDLQKQVATLRQQIQATEDFQRGIFKPFPAGQIQIRKLIHKEAEDLIGHLNDVTDFARTADKIPSIFDLLPFDRPNVPQQAHYPQSLENPGIPAAAARLREFQEAVTAFRDGLNGKISAEPKYAADLSYIVGTTNADNLITAVSTYTYRLELIDKDNAKHPDYPLNLQIITFVVGDSAMQTQKALMHFWQWSNEFVNQRSGLARQEINKYL